MQNLTIVEGVATLKVQSLKDVREAMTYDQKYLYYKEVQVRRASAETQIPVKKTFQSGSTEGSESVGALRLRGLPFRATDDEII